MPLPTDPARDLAARLRGLRRHGLRRGLETAASIAEDVFFDLHRRVETGRSVGIGAAGPVLGDHGAHGRAYHATRVRHFRKLMAALSLPPGLGLLDYGAGKGRVLLLAGELPFARVVGVEYAPALCAEAERNLDVWRARTGRGANVEIVRADAATWEVAPDLHVFYLFNPFDEVVLARVVDQVHASLRRHPRPAWLVSNKARPDVIVGRRGLFRPHLDLAYGNAEFRVYACPG